MLHLIANILLAIVCFPCKLYKWLKQEDSNYLHPYHSAATPSTSSSYPHRTKRLLNDTCSGFADKHVNTTFNPSSSTSLGGWSKNALINTQSVSSAARLKHDQEGSISISIPSASSPSTTTTSLGGKNTFINTKSVLQRLLNDPQLPPTAARLKQEGSISISIPYVSSAAGSSSIVSNDNINPRKSTTAVYKIPEDILGLIKREIIPQVLNKPLSQSTYKDFFASLLYAEDYYIEKWSHFCLSSVTLELHKSAVYDKPSKTKNLMQKGKKDDDKLLVAFEIDSIPERRPFLLSRDYVFVRPSGKKVDPFQGILYRVVKSTLVLVDFKDDFHSQHHPQRKYDVSFSFNRVCLKRCHNAIDTAVSNPSLLNFLFPNPTTNYSPTVPYHSNSNLKGKDDSAIRHISTFPKCYNVPPYLIEGPPCVTNGQLSKTGLLIQKMILQTLRNSPNYRVLLCAPLNKTCDVFTRSLKTYMSESDILRANAAFRDLEDVPDDILSACPNYEGERFTCPSLENLQKVRVIISTFMTSSRLKTAGISSGHFSHIYLVDASLATEPETMVSLANFASEKTCVVVSGSEKNFPGLVRSDIGRKHGLQKSYFQRLIGSEPYSNIHSTLILRMNSSHRN